MTRLLVFGDSLTFHGPKEVVPFNDKRLWTQQAAAGLARANQQPVVVDIFARLGWTARDAWWAMTKDPHCWGEAMPRADALIIATGGMDQLPAAVPSYVREGIAYLRPYPLRRGVRTAYQQLSPSVMRLTRGRMRQLPLTVTANYHRKIAAGLRFYRPEVPIFLMTPAPFQSRHYPASWHLHAQAHQAAVDLAQSAGLHLIDIDSIVTTSFAQKRNNPDGLHWDWQTHAEVGSLVASTLAPLLAGVASTNQVAP